MDRAQAELDALKRTEEDLKKGHQKLEEMVSRLDQEVVRDHSLLNIIPIFFLPSYTADFFFNNKNQLVSTSLKSTGISSC